MAITGSIIIAALLFMIFGVGGIVLQIFLSRSESRWPGLILPILTLVVSLLAIVGFAAYAGGDGSSVRITAIYIFLNMNFSTLILILIYFVCRKIKKRKTRDEIDRMKIQDL